MLSRCLATAASALVVSAVQLQFESLNSVQQRASFHEGVAIQGIAETVPTTEKGYQVVAALKDDEQMKAFIHRVLQNEARYSKSPGELSGIVPYYSGTMSTQSLDALKKELRTATWIGEGEGRTAPLTEAGYQNVVKFGRPHVMAFARRILDAAGNTPSDEGAFAGMIPYFDGEVSVQDFETLRNELLSAAWAKPRDSELLSPVALDEQAVVVGAEKQKAEEGSAPSTAPEGFELIDMDGDGFIDLKELKKYMATLEREFSDEEVTSMFEEGDLSKDGRIDHEEFENLMAD